MDTNPFVELFDKLGTQAYDENNAGFRPIMENLHYLMGLAFGDLPADARVLCVGVGTGNELVHLARQFPGWRFVGIEPSAAMIEGCREKLRREGITDRCELFHGYLDAYVTQEPFDGAACLLVLHFVKNRGERVGMFRAMRDLLKPGGRLVHGEISCEFDAPAYPLLLELWTKMHESAGTTAESLKRKEAMLKDQLGVLPAVDTEAMVRAAGFSHTACFFQAILIRAWLSIA